MENVQQMTPIEDADEVKDFARVGAMVDQGEPEPGALVDPVPEAPAVDAAESMAGLLTVAGMLAGETGFKRTAAIWNPETCKNIAAKAVPVLRKYPWGVRVLDFFETGAGVEEIALGVVLIPAVLATYRAVSDDMAEAAEPKQENKPDPVRREAMPATSTDFREVGTNADQ